MVLVRTEFFESFSSAIDPGIGVDAGHRLGFRFGLEENRGASRLSEEQNVDLEGFFRTDSCLGECSYRPLRERELPGSAGVCDRELGSEPRVPSEHSPEFSVPEIRFARQVPSCPPRTTRNAIHHSARRCS